MLAPGEVSVLTKARLVMIENVLFERVIELSHNSVEDGEYAGLAQADGELV